MQPKNLQELYDIIESYIKPYPPDELDFDSKILTHVLLTQLKEAINLQEVAASKRPKLNINIRLDKPKVCFRKARKYEDTLYPSYSSPYEMDDDLYGLTAFDIGADF